MTAAVVTGVTVVRTRAELAAARAALTGDVAAVMTMGALHEGHATLLRVARDQPGVGAVIATIFVNPLQFGPGEDLDRYPRPLEADLDVCAREGVDVVFTPTPDVVYPDRPLVTVAAGPMGRDYEGTTRPGHFDGVLTVVAKLLHLLDPEVALFGEKDAQQLALIRRMVRDLDFRSAVVGVPTVREPDGLALSSRNRYLSAAERTSALAISAALRAGRDAAGNGAAAVLAAAAETYACEPSLELDYLALVDPATFDAVTESHTGSALLITAARAGGTRLIDNLKIDLPGKEPL